jgi:bleomycin hydrolase
MLDGYKKDNSVSRMRAKKKQALAEVYKILVLNLGQPPKTFTWRYTVKAQDSDADKESEDEDDVAQPLSERQTFTPRSFYETFVNVDLSQYVNIADDPIRAKGTHSEVLITKNLFNGQNAHFANVSRSTLKQVAVAMLLDNRALYFAADVSPDQDSKKGIMADGLYDFESVYGLDMSISKRQRLLYRDSTVNHGMAFIGVDLLSGTPQKWLVENSWGSDKGQSGLWTMYDNWFDQYVFNLVVHKKYLPKAVLDILEKPATPLPAWDPMW